mgnify:CR=1 FL=1
MSNFIKKLFGTLVQKPWESERASIDNAHQGKTFDISLQKSAVIIIFGVATVLFSLLFTGYIYTLPPEDETNNIKNNGDVDYDRNLFNSELVNNSGIPGFDPTDQDIGKKNSIDMKF